MALTERTARIGAAVTGGVYALVYLYGAGDIDVMPRPAWGFQVAGFEPALWLSRRGPLTFEAVALADAGYLTILLSPANLVVAGLLGLLVALNLHGALALGASTPTCPGGVRGGRASGLFAAAPALLAGSACCAPSLLLMLGVPSLGALAGLFGWLVPLSLLLLVGSRLWQRQQGAPAWRGARRVG